MSSGSKKLLLLVKTFNALSAEVNLQTLAAARQTVADQSAASAGPSQRADPVIRQQMQQASVSTCTHGAGNRSVIQQA